MRRDVEAWEVESFRRVLGDSGKATAEERGMAWSVKVKPCRRGAEIAKQAKVMAMMRREERKEKNDTRTRRNNEYGDEMVMGRGKKEVR
jgi:hypothetical protein